MPKAKTPADLTITPRDRRFGRDTAQRRWWLNGDPIATAFYNALSVTFPKGEGFFIDSVRRFREGTPPRLQAEIAAFTKQEVMHTREHVAFNRHVTGEGYDISSLEADVQEQIDLAKSRPEIASLAATMCLEHFTAILAHELLANPKHLAGADPEAGRLWRWHALEEIEHKGVAYDTWLHATRDWSRWQRWKVKSIVMLHTTYRFVRGRKRGMLELLRQDGLTGPRVAWRLFWYAFGNPGMGRKILGQWLAFFMPGFHPWNHDDRTLIGKAESDYADAVLPDTAAA
ncbi:metal-dependent hydrolase [Stakelama tenebrarum]|uniref:Metal-dependent hydrolase n=1 Tax=Stakelama tenebrarum TaxID=2711215 RepID=A0A6G6Y5J4_9SPHN|nr:metal-dependent hydrolase [Sphingosinithalassobacter tenebrarum]QIG79846.1 metal-dependent hydrolase [Sphingosinithalassobacter tenebrarum]